MKDRKDEIKLLIKEYGMQRVLEDITSITQDVYDISCINDDHTKVIPRRYLSILVNDLQNTYDNYMLRHNEQN